MGFIKSCFVCQRLCGSRPNVSLKIALRYSHCLVGKSCRCRNDSPFIWMSANSNILNRELSNPMKDEPSRFTDDTERSISLSIDGTEFKSGSSFREKDFLNSKSESNLNGSKLIDSLQILCKIPGFLKDQENLFEYTRCNVEQIRHPRVYSDLNFVSKKSSSSINDVECFVSSLRIDAPEKQSYNGYTSTNTSRTMYYNAFDKSHYTYFKSDSDRCKFAKNEKDTKETRSKSQMVAMETISQHITEQLPYFFITSDDYSMYSKGLIFRNHVLGSTTRGLRMYKLQVQCYRWMKKLFWTDLNIDILKLTKHSEDNTIKVRWQVRGLPKYNIPFMLMSRGFGERQQWYRYSDYFSILHVGESGLVEKHHLMKMQPAQTLKRKAAIFSLFPFLRLPEIKEEPVIPSSTSQSSKVASPP